MIYSCNLIITSNSYTVLVHAILILFFLAEPFLKSANYSLISLNIEDIDSLTPLVLETGIDISKPTLIVAEYVLPYLEKERLIFQKIDRLPCKYIVCACLLFL